MEYPGFSYPPLIRLEVKMEDNLGAKHFMYRWNHSVGPCNDGTFGVFLSPAPRHAAQKKNLISLFWFLNAATQMHWGFENHILSSESLILSKKKSLICFLYIFLFGSTHTRPFLSGLTSVGSNNLAVGMGNKF